HQDSGQIWWAPVPSQGFLSMIILPTKYHDWVTPAFLLLPIFWPDALMALPSDSKPLGDILARPGRAGDELLT
ncbi:MAG: hypothetical protein ACREJN_16275, partial [Nitrospiraceae bacterium]